MNIQEIISDLEDWTDELKTLEKERDKLEDAIEGLQSDISLAKQSIIDMLDAIN